MITFDRYRDAVARGPRITPEREVELAHAYRAGDAGAGQQLVLANLRFALKIARRFARHGLLLEEVVQQANLGMLRAAQTFDPALGRFVTYAHPWMVQAIQRWLLLRRPTVRMPAGSADGQRVTAVYRRTSPDRPEALASAAGISVKRAEEFWPALRPALSLHITKRGREEMLIDALSAESGEQADPIMRAHLVDALMELDPRARDIIVRRVFSEETRVAIAKDHGIGRERVRQIENATLAALRERLARVHQEAA